LFKHTRALQGLGENQKISELEIEIFYFFGFCKKAKSIIGTTTSGAERTILFIGRALMSQAKLLLIDEPSVGLAPKIKEDLFKRIRDIHGMGITILMTEQDVSFAFDWRRRCSKTTR
jgi:branched-chain amino acid transport system ATP-binding protein